MLKVSNLVVSFGHRRNVAVNEVSFSISSGQRLGLIGESGSGKSVTALAIMGLLPENAQVSGSITLNGEELIGASDSRLRKLRGKSLSMMFQEPMTALDPTMKIGLQLREAYELHNPRSNSVAEMLSAVLNRVGLAELKDIAQTYPHELSGGQRQRVLLAMALVNQPELIICDEPTTALDVLVQSEILQVLRCELDSCLFITHDISVMSRVCDTVAIMLEGRIVETGELNQILTDPQHPYTRGLIATSRMKKIPGTNRLSTVDDYFTRENK